MHLLAVLGTRPEAIKLAPVIREAARENIHVTTVLTGQHRDLVAPLMKIFGVQTNHDLDVMTPNQSLTSLSAKVLSRLDQVPQACEVDCLLVQGDTTSAFIAGYWGFCRRIPVAHVEAGLRTYDLDHPYPEEANRQLLSRIAMFHFAPTHKAANALLDEGLCAKQIHVVGNTSIDSLRYALGLIHDDSIASDQKLDPAITRFVEDGPVVMITAHRRESFGDGFNRICHGILQLAEQAPQCKFVYPVHPNPNVRNSVMRLLGQHPRILLCDPLPYLAFLHLMQRSNLILTDSGGVQEEAPSLRKPILVMRSETERPEGVDAGFSVLVGTDPDRIVTEGLKALKLGLTTKAENPYGDGTAARQVVSILQNHLVQIRSCRRRNSLFSIPPANPVNAPFAPITR
jgi:UDP-N-acetylglucosamine 2-epimerase (non-hydrolysing)